MTRTTDTSHTDFDDIGTLQENRLLRILHAASETDYGRRHDFAGTGSAAQFAATVPVNRHHTLRSMIEMQRLTGEAILTPETPVFYKKVIGRSGTGRLVPVSPSDRALRARRLDETADAMKQATGFYRAQTLDLSSLTESGWLAEEAVHLTGEKALPDVRSAGDIEVRGYLLALMAMASGDVSGIFSPDRAAFGIFERVLARHSADLVFDIEQQTIGVADRVSPELRKLVKLFMTASPDRLHELKRLVFENGSLSIRDICPALRTVAVDVSFGDFPALPDGVAAFDIGCWLPEAPLTMPGQDAGISGVPMLHDSFLEFRQPGTQEMVRLHELEQGTDYRVHITNGSGLYRYQLDGVATVTGWHQACPLLGFRRTGTVVLAESDPVPSHAQALTAAREALKDLDIGTPFVRLFSGDCPGSFTMIVNRETFGARCQSALAEAFDTHLRAANFWYAHARANGHVAQVTIRFSEVCARPAASFRERHACNAA
ncbi:GH3 family domain-containing protein [Minwuia sp.]|uniref:GH3 family domain-containing protein n=1 Tax=Minwuia sp. TaxID=2493630 RepID=UPI003A9488DF